MSKILPHLLISALFSLLPQTAQARDYAIELIVFEQAGSDTTVNTTAAEKWDFSARKIAGNLQHIAMLESRSDDFPTTAEMNHLNHTRRQLTQAGHRILRTASWTQPSAVYQHAPLIPLGLADTPLATGFIRVYKTSLIYADIDLQFSPESPASATLPDLSSALPASVPVGTQTSSPLSGNLPEHYFLSEKRRLKFREVHYFDHPKFGVILGIWPVSAN